MVVVLPEGTGRQGEGRSTNRGALFVGAVLLVAFGFVILGGLTSSDSPTAAEQSTTTTVPATSPTDQLLPPVDMENFSVEQLETGPQFDWEQTETDLQGYPVEVLVHDGSVYVFTSSGPEYRGLPGGLFAWRSQDGSTWESLGQVISEEYLVSRVASTPRGLVAAGRTNDRSAILVWTSSDGANWASEELPIEQPHTHIETGVTAIGASEDALVLATNDQFNRERLVEERLEAAGYDIEITLTGFGTRYGGEDGADLTISGPLGLPGLEIPLDELDLTEDERRWISSGLPANPAPKIFARPTGSSGWITTEIEGGNFVDSIVTRDDGSMWLSGWSDTGRLSMFSSNGVDWTEVVSDVELYLTQSWRDGLLALDETSQPGLLYSEEGEEWEELGLAGRFPPPIQWWAHPFDAGDQGIALGVAGYYDSAPSDPGPIEMETDEGDTLTIDLGRNVMELETGDTDHSWAIYSAQTPEGISVDVIERTITLSDQDTGEPLTVLTFDELVEAEQDHFSFRYQTDEHHVLAFTPDGSEWTIQSAANAFDDGSRLGDLVILEDRLVALTYRSGSLYDPLGPPALDVWTAELP